MRGSRSSLWRSDRVIAHGRFRCVGPIPPPYHLEKTECKDTGDGCFYWSRLHRPRKKVRGTEVERAVDYVRDAAKWLHDTDVEIEGARLDQDQPRRA